eukprot:3932071-Rhodomonas_salina.2
MLATSGLDARGSSPRGCLSCAAGLPASGGRDREDVWKGEVKVCDGYGVWSGFVRRNGGGESREMRRRDEGGGRREEGREWKSTFFCILTVDFMLDRIWCLTSLSMALICSRKRLGREKANFCQARGHEQGPMRR